MSRRNPRDDRGTSLAELVVTIGLMALVGTMVLTVSVMVLRSFAGVGARNDNYVQGELGVAAAGKVLRTAILPEQLQDVQCTGCGDTAIVSASSTSIMFYANIGNTTIGPSKVVLKVVPDPKAPGTSQLVQETEAPIPQGAGAYTFCNRSSPSTCVLTTHVLARGLVTSAPALFTYYDFDGIAMAQSTVSANLAKVYSIDLTITTQTKPGAGYPSRTTVSRVRLPNVENVQSENLT